ncbi:hypothetical protein CDL12_05631 [Handroanthus impetiginosus]|uniref:F-box domain-containing protein n=1 Tax=Handroanthus impetiginosus TaxID=429701 RepID=A0A2G9HW19_9LAMI|nr:hypothetical protein CDL12_05631 [Handroanthus impetiginosus]
MGARIRESCCNPVDRYQTLRLSEFLSKPSHYALACKELSLVLKSAYAKLPKDLQSLLFQETLFAFSLLSEMQTQSAFSAANSLSKSAEFALPKQKRALAVKEYKHAIVASKRKPKANREEPGLCPLPHDVLVHIFSFLDVHSVVSASAVCRSWNTAANDNHLWKFLYAISFCDSNIITTNSKIKNLGVANNKGKIHSPDSVDTAFDFDARCEFRLAYKGRRYSRLKSCRGYCSSCRSIVWLSNYKCYNESNTKDGSSHQIKPISTQQIVEYILDGFVLPESSSDSDSDSEDGLVHKLWAYPRQIG